MELKQLYRQEIAWSLYEQTAVHISLCRFFLPPQKEQEMLQLLSALFPSESIPITLKKVAGFPEARLLYLKPDSQGALERLQKELLRLGKGDAFPGRHFRMPQHLHLSLAKANKDEAYQKGLSLFTQQGFEASFLASDWQVLKRKKQKEVWQEVLTFRSKH
jgi:2'-5' RNA ligase